MVWLIRGRLVTALLAAFLLLLGAVPVVLADGAHIVSVGETLSGIAQRYGVSVQALAQANGLYGNSWVYAGQTLTIPGSGSAAAPAPAAQTPSRGGAYTVRYGDTLSAIASLHGTTVQALLNANGLTSSLIYAGQTLVIPSANPSPPPPTPVPATPAPSNPTANGEKWIDVDLTNQTITAYEGNTAVYSAVVSTGLPRTPTVTGTYKIYVKYRYANMQGGSYAAGDYYYLPNVPFTMYFYRGYGIHGTYWHDNFGQPMSHGCVNLRTSDAEWFFNWAEVGTKVVSHY
ncbi:MAG: LysM peptidoglycan-binding domain-containing protein [Chloroflexota bacterium]|nr:LysM peptidoglycan-binding domain-containing protein [Chloroflexota bacterium]